MKYCRGPVIFLIILFSPPQLLSQNLDSLLETAFKNYSEKKYIESAEAFKKAYEADAAHNPKRLYQAGNSYALAGENDSAFIMLEKALNAGWSEKFALEQNPELDGLRKDARWQEFYNKASLNYNSQKKIFFWGLYFGLLSVLFLFNMFLFFSTRDRSFLYYSLMLLADAHFELYWNRENTHFFLSVFGWMNFAMLKSFFWRGVVFHLLFIFYLLFVISFLKLKESMPRTRKIFLGFILFFVISFLGGVLNIGRNVFSLLESIFVPLIFIFPVIIAIISWRRGNTQARFFVLAMAVLCAGMIRILASTFGIGDNGYDTKDTFNIANIGLLFFYTCLSFALGDKMRLMRLEKEHAQKKCNGSS